MRVIEKIQSEHEEMTQWRHHLHAHPETAFQEHMTADFVAAKLTEWGIKVHRGLATTGVVGTLTAGDGQRAIGLRADMDALDLKELNDFAHRSKHEGKMHGCGHDGHTTMLLGAAKYLAQTRKFNGVVHFIFQPAEENEAGGRVMIEQGLFRQFPVDSVYGMHNMPGIEVGQFAVRSGPMMASADFFFITIHGTGTHGAFPHQGVDPIVVAAELVMALQSIVSRNTDPMEAAVVSVTQINAGHTTNVIPDHVTLAGTTRAFKPQVQDRIEARMRQIVEGLAAAHGVKAEMRYERRYPPTINSEAETEIAAATAAEIVGAPNVLRQLPPVMGAEDFGWMLQERPGSYVWIGNGIEHAGGCMVHNPRYDFNDRILPLGASYFARLVERSLPAGG